MDFDAALEQPSPARKTFREEKSTSTTEAAKANWNLAPKVTLPDLLFTLPRHLECNVSIRGSQMGHSGQPRDFVLRVHPQTLEES